jgi:F420-dependent oxidoreductase-like protein
MRLGVALSYAGIPGDRAQYGRRLSEAAQAAEAAGFDSLSVWDHFMSHVGSGLPMLEGYTTLGFIAATTRTIKIGAMVTGVTHRHPGILIKQVTTLDVLSGGRAYFGIGAAWFTEEHGAYGIAFPPARERLDRLEETLQIAHLMWADQGDYAQAQPFLGKYYQLEHTLNVPQSIQRPHPPIMVGGSGERRTLRIAAQYADACNFKARSMDQLEHKLDVIRGHCRDVGRSFESLEKTLYCLLGRISVNGRDGGLNPNQFVTYCKEVSSRGIDAVILDHEQLNVFDPVEVDLWKTDIVPAVRALPDLSD